MSPETIAFIKEHVNAEVGGVEIVFELEDGYQVKPDNEHYKEMFTSFALNLYHKMLEDQIAELMQRI